ncbi:nuclear transport factor 2 family protein [[Mycobacterium] kokjensenii]|uniref:Nuclear transport factor 2 family protein n=1 Tax=[Mycobacterium] kokjensenii TaxID=3064287 RepID=A0ABN9NGX0_9MYCO|nr:nuclear transport factor 2 family protein [Mycolicibacter sp. MU0083]CAJ1506152.1 nuclear transport factor 2 family protein [Mycolicibacter sp. MU0083]
MTERRLAELERRLAQIEDERAIERLIASYGPLVDAGDAEAVAGLWHEDGVYDVENWTMSGREEIAAMVRSRGHQELIGGGCTHFLGPAVATVHGDEAVAVCDSTLLVRQDNGFRVARAGANYFHLRRDPESPARWRIVRRVTRLLDGAAEGRALLADGIAGRIRADRPPHSKR